MGFTYCLQTVKDVPVEVIDSRDLFFLNTMILTGTFFRYLNLILDRHNPNLLFNSCFLQ